MPVAQTVYGLDQNGCVSELYSDIGMREELFDAFGYLEGTPPPAIDRTRVRRFEKIDHEEYDELFRRPAGGFLTVEDLPALMAVKVARLRVAPDEDGVLHVRDIVFSGKRS